MFYFSKLQAEKVFLLMVVYGALSTKDVLSYQDAHLSSKELSFSSRVVHEYMSYSDMELFAIPVPEMASQVNVYFSINSDSSVCKQSSIEVYYQYGAPPLPPHQTFNNRTFIERKFSGNKVFSTDTKKPLLLDKAMPGTWYLGVLVPKSNGVKRRAELGFGNASSDSCSFDVGLRVVITVVDSVPLLPSDGESVTDELPLRQNIRYYRYQHLNASARLVVKISGCFSVHTGRKIPGFCPLNLSVSSRALPAKKPGGSHSKKCSEVGQDPCLVTMPTTEQEMWSYYVTTERLPATEAYHIYYNISVTQIDCSQTLMTLLNGHSSLTQISFDPACAPVQEMFSLSTGRVLNRQFTPNKGNSSVSLQGNIPTFYSFKVSSDFVGSMLGVQVTFQSTTPNQVLICLQKDFVPSFYIKLFDNPEYYSMNCSGQMASAGQYYNRELNIFVPFPGEGVWYLSLYAKSGLTSDIRLYVEMQACSADCSNHGTCNINTKPDIVYGSCACDAGYKGWACGEDKDVDLASILLLTLSSLAFLVDVVIARWKKLYPETLVYLFLFIVSILYHLCNSGVICAMDDSFLQTCDLFAILLSVWVTLVALTNHRAPTFTSTLNMLAVLVLFVSVREAARSILPFVLTVGFGVLLVIFYNVTLWCQKVPTASFSKKRWALFILPATIMILMSFICFSLLETEDNYMYIHSLGHILLGFGIALLLPNHRPYARRAHYDLSREFDSETTREDSSSRRNLVNEVRHV